MPIGYEIDDERGLVITTLEGVVTVEDLVRHGEAMANDARRSQALNELVDLTEVEGAEVPTRALREFAQAMREKDRNTPGTKLAFVAPSDAAFGLARMFEVYRDHPAFETRVFRDAATALHWLGLES